MAEKIISCYRTGNRRPASRVTGGDTFHYTTEDYNFENGPYVFALKGN